MSESRCGTAIPRRRVRMLDLRTAMWKRILVSSLLLAVACAPAAAPAAPTTGQPAATGAQPTAKPAAATAPAAAPATSGDTWKIGTLWPLSGTAASWGNDNFVGATIAADMANEKGGVLGKKVDLIKGDNQSNPTAGVNEANRQITQEGVKVIVGTVVSGVALPVTEVADRAHVAYFEADAATDDLTKRGLKYLFRINETAGMHAQAGFDFAKDVALPKLGMTPANTRVAITHEDSAFGTSVADAAETYAKKLGFNVIDRQSYDAKAVDLSSMLLKIKSENPDIYFNVGYSPDAILQAKQMAQLDFNPKLILGGGDWALQDVGDGVGKTINGIVDGSGPVGINTNGLQPEAKALHTEFLKRYDQKLPGKVPSYSAFQGFVAMHLLLNDVLPKAGAMDSDKIRDAAMSLDLPNGSTILGWGVKFDPETHQNSRAIGAAMQWQNQEVSVVYPEALAKKPASMIPLPSWNDRSK